MATGKTTVTETIGTKEATVVGDKTTTITIEIGEVGKISTNSIIIIKGI